MLIAIRPGIFNMIGYSITLLIFPENSQENLKYGKIIIYLFDTICGLILFGIVFKLSNRIFK